MGFEAKPYEEIMKSMVDQLSKALEVDMFGGIPMHEQGVRKILGKLGVKSAKSGSSLFWGSPLQMESLEDILKPGIITYDAKDLKPWIK